MLYNLQKEPVKIKKREQNMGDFLIVSLAEELQAYEDLAQEYQVGFEINDFYDPLVFEDKKRREDIIQKYQKAGIPAGSTMHGAFYDVSVFSYDPQIREISKLRMRQSMEIAQELSVKGLYSTQIGIRCFLILYMMIRWLTAPVHSSGNC